MTQSNKRRIQCETDPRFRFLTAVLGQYFHLSERQVQFILLKTVFTVFCSPVQETADTDTHTDGPGLR